METFQALLTTFSHRPYILTFLIAFLVIGILNMGIRRTLLFLGIGYTVAWASEACSIRTGFPYGWYYYIYDSMPGELMVWGVPFWDSLSYTFVAYASLVTTEYIYTKVGSPILSSSLTSTASVLDYSVTTQPKSPNSQKQGLRLLIQKIFFAAFLMVLIDMLADPLAFRGDQWFLGKIYGYKEAGFYFGIPFSNFLGWFLVALTTFSLFHLLDKNRPLLSEDKRKKILGPLLYLGLVLFNLTLTLWIGEIRLALFGIVLITGGITAAVLAARSRQKKAF